MRAGPIPLLLTLLVGSVVAAEPVALDGILEKPPATGLLLTRIVPASAAERGGLLVGDIVLAYSDQAVTTLGSLKQAISRAAGPEVALRIARDGTERVVTMPAGKLGVIGEAVVAGIETGHRSGGAASVSATTITALDLQAIPPAGLDQWFIANANGRTVGLQRFRAACAAGVLTVDMEWAVDLGAEFGGAQHTVNRSRYALQPLPALLTAHVEDGAAIWDLAVTAQGLRVRRPDATTADLAQVPAQAVDGGVLPIIALLLPRTPAATLRVALYQDGEDPPFGEVALRSAPAARYASGREPAVPVWQEARDRRAVCAWVDADGRRIRRIVLADQEPLVLTADAATREEALAAVPAGMKLTLE